MTAIPFGTGSYKRNTGAFAETRLVNQYVEELPQGEIRLVGRPGLTPAFLIGDQPIEGVFSQPGCFDGDIFAVTGDKLTRNGEEVGDLPADGRVSFAGDGLELLIATGTAMYSYNGTDVSLVVFPDDAGENSVVFFAGLFVVARTGSQKFYWSAVLDGSTWDSLSFASAERKPDNLTGIAVVGDELWLFGENSTEFWVATGDGDLPFTRIDGRVYDKGAINRDVICSFDNSVAWVGQDKIVYIGGPVPQRVSDFGIEERLTRTDAETVHAWSFTVAGKYFYCLTTDDGTYALEAASREWCEFKSFSRTGWRAHLGCIQGAITYAGDDTTGTIWQLDPATLLDDGEPIERICTAIVKHTGQPLALNSLHVDIGPGQTTVSTGQGSNPVVEMRSSRDGGKTYAAWDSASAGEEGSYRTRTMWRRLGLIDEPGRVFEFRSTDPVPWTFSGVRVNEMAGGRARGD